MKISIIATLFVISTSFLACAPAVPMQQALQPVVPPDLSGDQSKRLEIAPQQGQIYAIAAGKYYSPGDFGQAFVSFIDSSGKQQPATNVKAMDGTTQAKLLVMPGGAPNIYRIQIPATVTTSPYMVLVSADGAMEPAGIAFNIKSASGSYSSSTVNTNQLALLTQNLGSMAQKFQGLRSMFPACSSGTCPNPSSCPTGNCGAASQQSPPAQQ